MSDQARAWLAMRAGPVPPVLEARMESAVDDVPGDDVTADALADAALACLRAALAGGDDRNAALHLLAADALITYACEAAAADGDALLRVTSVWSPARLALLLDGTRAP